MISRNVRSTFRGLGIFTHLRSFWGKEELYILALNLAVHTIIQLVALQFMPLPYYSQLSLHDGEVYYQISQDLFPDSPLFRVHWHKRILMPLIVAIFFPWNRQLGFLLVGILAASLSAVYFYKVAKQYIESAFAISIIYSFLPYLFFSAHHGLVEPLMMLFLLAGYYYFLQSRPFKSSMCYSLAVLSKEIALIPLGALIVTLVIKRKWRKAILMSSALLAVIAFWLFYGWRWGDFSWYFRAGQLSLTPGPWRMIQALLDPPSSSANAMVNLVYNLFNQVANATVLILTVVGICKLRDKSLTFCSALALIPLWFMGQNLHSPQENLYTLNVNLGRQFLIAWPALLGLDQWLKKQGNRIPLILALVLGGMLGLSFLWILMYAKFFLHYKFF